MENFGEVVARINGFWGDMNDIVSCGLFEDMGLTDNSEEEEG